MDKWKYPSKAVASIAVCAVGFGITHIVGVMVGDAAMIGALAILTMILIIIGLVVVWA